jgi:hypothetical protein
MAALSPLARSWQSRRSSPNGAVVPGTSTDGSALVAVAVAVAAVARRLTPRVLLGLRVDGGPRVLPAPALLTLDRPAGRGDAVAAAFSPREGRFAVDRCVVAAMGTLNTPGGINGEITGCCAI